jgi:phospholipase C
MYQMAATSFGHVVTDPLGAHAENSPPEGGYQPKNGAIFDLLDKHKVSWAEYYEWNERDSSAPLRLIFTPPRPYGLLFRQPYSSNFKPLAKFFDAAGKGSLPQVVFIDLNQHEHPPYDIRRGQHQVARVVEALRTSPNWKDSILFLTYDENGGFYDHVAPPPAVSPDDIPPGKCADKNNPPNSTIWGNGVNCRKSAEAQRWLCPSGKNCADFNRLGFRVPLIAISPFAKHQYVSHVTTDHTSLLALIEKRFLDGEHLTKRDANATTPEDMLDFAASPSLDAKVHTSLAYEVSDGLCQTPIILKLSAHCD